MKSEKPWWWPVVADADWLAQLRSDYPEKAAAMDDDELKDYFNESGSKYIDTWDHLGDAREQFEELANAFLTLVKEAGRSPSDFE